MKTNHLFQWLAVLALMAGACTTTKPAEESAVATQPAPTEESSVATKPAPTKEPTVTPKPAPTQVSSVATSADKILGTWTNPSLGTHQFNGDGTFVSADSPETLDAPFATLKFWFEGNVMKIQEISVNGVPPCGPRVGQYEVRIRADGSMVLAAKSDACTARKDSMAGTYQPVP